MAQNQLLKIGTHAIKIHNMIKDDQEMEAWVAKKVDLASNYVKSVHGYTAGQKAGTFNDGGLTTEGGMPSSVIKHKQKLAMMTDKELADRFKDFDEDRLRRMAWGHGYGKMSSHYLDRIRNVMTSKRTGAIKEGCTKRKVNETYVRVKKDAEGEISQYAGRLGKVVDQDDDGDYLVSWGDNEGEDWIEKKNLEFLPDDAYWNPDDEDEYAKGTDGEVPTLDPEFSEDAGEGHMSKSQLYATAKMAIELIEMINKGDDLEGWVQTKLNLAADYLQAVYHYEDYQKLSPYREEIDNALTQRHAGIIQKHLDEILAKETKIEDVDTKPGMMRILKKRVNEVEKEIAKENRKQSEGLDEGMQEIKDWAKRLAVAGIFVAGLAGVGSINDAINNSVPAIQAMNTALEMANERGDDNLIAQIEKDLKDAKLRLDIGRDLNQVKYLQDKYEKFIAKENLAYESKLAIMLNQRIK
jgi:hypothetical protein